MNAGHGYQVGTTAFVEFIQVRLVLEEVGVHPLLVHLDIRLDVIGEYLHVQFHALLGQLRLHEFQDFGMGNRGGSYGEFFGSNGAGKRGCGS